MCLSVKSHLSFGASVRPENAVMYSVGNEDQRSKHLWRFLTLRCSRAMALAALYGRGVASGTASRALALLDFWLAGPIEPTIQRVFLAPLLDYWSSYFPMADSGGFLWFQFGSTRMRSDRRPSAVIFADVANWLMVAPFQLSN